MKYEGTYRGIIIQNNDPKHEGRVKVFVPGINLQQIKSWNQKKEEDKAFNVMGNNTNTSLTKDIIQNQKEKLFWAEVMMPLVGASAPGIYHAPADIFYIGNDSDFKFQSDNKTDIFFKKDARIAEQRESQPITFESDYIQPRTGIILNFRNTGKRYCFNSGCDNNASTPTFWNNSYANKCLNDLKNSLPKIYENTSLSSVDPTPKSSDINYNIDSIYIDVINPTILLDDIIVPRNNPIYNNLCDPVNAASDVPYSPPITFEKVSSTGRGMLADIPLNIMVNGKNTIGKKFKLDTTDEFTATYKADNVKVIVPLKNVRSINIKGNNNKFDITKILALVPLIINIINGIIMPRAPMSGGQTMHSRGGGGGEIYNNVTTNLLDEQQRRNSHIGGANNQSRFTANHGRTSLNDDNNTKGDNVQTGALQLHRGPLRSPDYSNDWKGLISIPGVGSHVWVKFENGDPLYPIIVGTFASRADYKGIFESK